MQCWGTEDLNGVTTVTDNNDPDWQKNWGTDVVRHTAKPVDPMDASQGNIYEEFYSADFGAAGRWMTTNLAATAYDGNAHSQGAALTLSNLRSLPAPYYCYPNGPTQPTLWYHQQGLLYNWSAATAGKGGDTGQKNIYSMSAANQNVNNEDSWPYHPDQLNGTMTSFPGNSSMGNYQWRIQGICPQGWHLPSDREWTELENAIIQYTSSYADMAEHNPKPRRCPPLAENNGTTSWRGSFQGLAMKEICGVTAIIPNGLSNRLSGNGFNVLLVGAASGGGISDYKNNAYFWISSVHTGTDNAWSRWLKKAEDRVLRTSNDDRGNLCSVRCKKD